MHSHRASALLFYLTNVLLVYKGALSLEAQGETSGANETDHQRTLGRTANDDEVLKNVLPLVTFDCLGKNGYFADKKFDCEVFHYCDPNGSRSTFHCPNNFFFNSDLMVCDQMTESKKGLCWKNEDANHKEKKTLGKNISDSKLKISETTKKKNVEKSSTKFKTPVTEDLDQVSSDLTVSFSDNIPQMDGMMALEDILSYMNSDNNPDHPKTFISTFSGDRSSKALVNTSIINPFKKLKGRASDSAENPQDVEIQKTSSKQGKHEAGLLIDISGEQEAIPRKRKRGRRGSTLSSEESWSESNGGHHHSHVSVRSPAEDHVEEKKDYDRWEEKPPSTESSPPSGSLRLFDIESRRNSTDPWRKKRRYYRRRKKNRNQNSSTALYGDSPSNTTDVYDERFLESHRTKDKQPDMAEWQRSGSASNAMKPQISSSIKVSFMHHENEPTVHNSQHTGSKEIQSFGEIPVNTNTEPKVSAGSRQNPWFTSTLADEDDNYNYRFGERTTTSGTGIAPQPFYGDENGSVITSHFFGFEGKPDRSSFNQNAKTLHVGNPTQKPKLKFGSDRKSESTRRGNIKVSDRRPDEERKDPFWNQENTKERQKKVNEGQFPHSTDKTRRPTPQKKQEHEWSSPWSPVPPDVTTLSPPLPLKAAFSDTHESNIAAVMEEDGIKWKPRVTSESRNKPKVPVGSSYKQWKEEPKAPPPDTPKLNTTPSARVKQKEKNSANPHRNIHRERKKEWPKQTLAHQHLSKVMNDFLAIPPVNLGLPKVNNVVVPSKTYEAFVPKYRIPNEDIYVSESIPKETVKNQRPGIFDIVDLISKHSIGKPKEIAVPSNDGSDGHQLTMKEALMSVKSIHENKEKLPSSDIEIVDLRETLEDLFGTGLDKIIGKDHSKEYENDREGPRIIKGSIKKLTELSEEEQEELKEITEIAKFTSLRLKPLLTTVLRHTSKEFSEASKNTAERAQLRPTIITAKKVPLRLLYADEDTTSKETTPKTVRKIPAVKVVRNRQQATRLKAMRHPPPVRTSAVPVMVLHPPSLRPPHPPPLHPRYPYPMMHMPYGGIRPMFYHQHYPYIPRRRKRSPQYLRRIGNQRWNYSPFSHGVISSLASNHGSSLFRRPFILQRFPTPSLPNPFRFPYALSGNGGIIRPRKPRLRKPVFLPRQPIRNIPQPVRHISQAVRNMQHPVRNIQQPLHNIPQSAHQTVIIEEVPIPIPVEVPHLPPQRVPALSSVRIPETLRPQRPMHLQDSRGHSPALTKPAQLHQAPFPFSIGLIETPPKPRPPSNTYSQPLSPIQGVVRPTGARDPKVQFKPPASQNSVGSPTPPLGINPNSNRNNQNRPAKPKPPVILTQIEFQKRPPTPQSSFPFDTKNLHVKSYPNFSYFHTGPPSSFKDFLSPHQEKNPKNPDISSGKKEAPKPPSEVRSRPTPSSRVKSFNSRHRESGTRFSTQPSVSITSSPGGLFVVSPPDSSTFPQHLTQNSQNTQSEPPLTFNWSEESKESSENGISNQRPNSSGGASSKERKVRRRRPGGRRRRPRPKAAQGLGNSTLSEASQPDNKTPANIWKIASPPQQIPPPPSEITTQTLNLNSGNEEERNPNQNVPTNVPTTSDPNVSGENSAFPPAGYYGSEQLSQILETSFSGPIKGINSVSALDYSTEIRLPSLSTTEQPAEESSLFSQEESAFYDEHDGVNGRVPFGTRLKTNPRSRTNPRQNTKQQNASPGAPQVVRNMQSAPPPTQNRYRGSSYNEPGSQSTDLRDTVQLPNKKMPDRSRYPGPGNIPNKDLRGIRPEVIYYDTREHPDGLFKIESDVHNSKPPTPVLVRNHAGTRDMFHLPNPYSDRDLFGLNPPSTPRPALSNSGFQGVTSLRAPPRDKPDFVIPRRPHMDHSSVGSPSVPNTPPRPSLFRQAENPQQQYRVRERKRPTAPPPKPKSEVRTSSLSHETTTARPYSQSTQVIHKTKEIQKTPEYPFYQHKQETSVSPKDVVTQRWTIKTTTPYPVTFPSSRNENFVTTTTAENLETKTPIEKSSGFLPVRGIPKTVQSAKLDLNKINASISTSVSVSSTNNGNHVSSSEALAEGQPKKVFSSKNGGLAVVQKRQRQRKRNRNRSRTTAIPKIESASSLENGLNEDEKLQIAASIQDIIKATSESERAQEKPPPTSEPANSTTVSAKVSKKWILPPPEDVSQTKKIT